MKNRNIALTIILLVLAWYAFSPKTWAVNPEPDGGYPGGNTAEGQSALFSLTTGGYNTAVGFFSLRSDTTSSFNTAIGAGTLLANTANENTATGAGALLSNSTGIENTANGAFALFSNTAGGSNTAIGVGAIQNNTGGNNNTAIGNVALFNTTTGDSNTANGGLALFSNTTGSANTAVGSSALVNSHGIANTALGANAGSGVTTANNVICIGNVQGANVSNTCFIGNIRDVTTQNADAIPVLIDSAGQLGTASSSRRYKKEIKPMNTASEAILALKPVTFYYKSDKTSTPQFGLIAEEVAKVNPGLVVRDKNGDIYTVRYDAVNAMLLNEFLKEHRAFVKHQRKLEAQEATMTELKHEFESKLAEQQNQIKALTSGLERANNQLDLNKSAPQMVLSNQ
jgi:hypothetical protein